MCNICNKASIYPHHQLPVEIEWVLSKANKSQRVSWEIPFPKIWWGSEASTSCPAGSSWPLSLQSPLHQTIGAGPSGDRSPAPCQPCAAP